MSFWIIGSLIAVSTGTQIYGQLEAGKDQEAALKTQAEEERVAAESRELERQQRLNKALAANAVGMGMSGIALESAKNVGLSEGMLKLSDRLAQAQLKRQAATTASASRIGAASTLLKGATKIYQATPDSPSDEGTP